MTKTRIRGRNPRYIYDYAPGGKSEGKQVRFKRAHKDEVETTSQYFSFARYGSRSAALVAAKAWLSKNERWIVDRQFKPRPARHPAFA